MYQNWIFTLTDDSDYLRREMLIGALFSGKPQLLWPCPKHLRLPEDLFSLTWSHYKIARKQQRDSFSNVLRETTYCELLK